MLMSGTDNHLLVTYHLYLFQYCDQSYCYATAPVWVRWQKRSVGIHFIKASLASKVYSMM